jgi:hypothetical protein
MSKVSTNCGTFRSMTVFFNLASLHILNSLVYSFIKPKYKYLIVTTSVLLIKDYQGLNDAPHLTTPQSIPHTIN